MINAVAIKQSIGAMKIPISKGLDQIDTGCVNEIS